MNEFLLYVALPALTAIALVSAFYAIKEGNKTARLSEDTRTQQHPAIKPIRDAEFYQHNGHWVFGVPSEPQPYNVHANYGGWEDGDFPSAYAESWHGHMTPGVCQGECDQHGV